MQTTDKQRYNPSIKVIELPYSAPSKMGNGVETDCLPFYAENSILSTRHSKTETDIRFDY